MAAVRLCVVADIHHGADKLPKKSSAALPLLEEFVRFVRETKPDAVIDLGDRITDADRETDLVLEREVKDVLRTIEQPVFHLCGNHDRDHLSVADNASVLGVRLDNETVDIGDWTLVLWRADTKFAMPDGFVLPDSDLDWLASVVDKATRPLAVFSHVPVSGQSQVGNYYFERVPERAAYARDGERIREVLRRARVPLACFAGHVHWNSVTTVNGQPHFTLQSLTETFTTHPRPAGAHALLDLSDEVEWTVFGRDRFHARIDAAQTARRWLDPK